MCPAGTEVSDPDKLMFDQCAKTKISTSPTTITPNGGIAEEIKASTDGFVKLQIRANR